MNAAVAADSENTSLMWAARRGEEELVLALLDAGADGRATSNQGATALDVTREREHAEIEAILRARFPR